MYHLATVVPRAQSLRLPFTRDQAMLFMTAVNELFLSIDIYIAHNLTGQIHGYEWIPVIFGAAAGIVLLLAGVIAFRNRPLATILANGVFVGSILVGLIGGYFHLQRTILLSQPVSGQQELVGALIWAPPFLGPFFFSLIGIMGISAAWVEEPTDSGRLRLLANRHIQMPYSKTRAYFFIVCIGILATLISSVLDHSRSNLVNPWVWLPITVGLFSITASCSMGIISRPTRTDLTVYTLAMILLIVTGLIGFLLHVNTNLSAQGFVIMERFVRGSPILAPTVFANWGLIGLLVLLDPREERQNSPTGG